MCAEITVTARTHAHSPGGERVRGAPHCGSCRDVTRVTCPAGPAAVPPESRHALKKDVVPRRGSCAVLLQEGAVWPERVNGERETQPEAQRRRIVSVHEVSPYRTTALAKSEGAGGAVASVDERGATLPPRVYSGAPSTIENLTLSMLDFGAMLHYFKEKDYWLKKPAAI